MWWNVVKCGLNVVKCGLKDFIFTPRFGELMTEYGKPPGYDRTRQREIGNKNIKVRTMIMMMMMIASWCLINILTSPSLLSWPPCLKLSHLSTGSSGFTKWTRCEWRHDDNEMGWDDVILAISISFFFDSQRPIFDPTPRAASITWWWRHLTHQ